MLNVERVTVSSSEVEAKDVHVGLTLGFLNLDQLDIFVKVLSDRLKAVVTLRGEDCAHKIIGGRLSQTLLNQRSTRSKRYNGPLKDPRVTILAPDLSFIKGTENIDPDHVVSFLTEADLYVTGKGLFATLEKLCSMYIRKGVRGRGLGESNHITFCNKAVNGYVINPENSELTDVSREIWTDTIKASNFLTDRVGLLHIVKRSLSLQN